MLLSLGTILISVDTIPTISTSVNISSRQFRRPPVARGANASARVIACCGAPGDRSLDITQATELAHAFAALSDPVRLRLLSLIATSRNGEVCACTMVEALDRSQPTVSHHLKVLREAGLVTSDKRGTWMWYRAVPERLAAVRAALG
ncbi:MAG: helix-turn-helix transcriptional regulator [Actinobacteria bacterium]|nr:helix-turn-helix transcriptional regulator [Actinomycetota bacterium]